MVDFLVTLLGAITFGIDIGLYGLLSVIVNGVVIDKIIAGFKVKSEITIISPKNKEISQYILNDLERVCTFIKGVGEDSVYCTSPKCVSTAGNMTLFV